MHDPHNILVVQPSWVGDAVMATPTLRALRGRFPRARITYLMRRNLKPVYAGMPWADRLITIKPKMSMVSLAARIRSAQFDLAVLLPNSFRSAMLVRLAGIPRIVGYDRDARRFLLTDRLRVPNRRNGRYIPSPIIHYYLGLAHYLGADDTEVKMELFITPDQAREAADVVRRAGLDPALRRPGERGSSPLVVLNPGARYGASKLWLPEYFAQVSDRMIEQWNATVMVSAAPSERAIVDAIRTHAKRPFIDLLSQRPSLGAVKAIVDRCDLMITNDTGPRHIAAAFGVPVVTVFGPTHPDWTHIYFARERQLSIKVDCGPCQLKKCPVDHRCMTGLKPEVVFDAAGELLGRRTPLPVTGG